MIAQKKQTHTQISKLHKESLSSTLEKETKSKEDLANQQKISREHQNAFLNISKDVSMSPNKLQLHFLTRKQSVVNEEIEKLIAAKEKSGKIKNNDNLPKSKELDFIEVQSEFLQSYKEEKQMNQRAKRFVMKLKKQKRLFDGKIHILKQKQKQRKQEFHQHQALQDSEAKRIKILEKHRLMEKRIQLFKQRMFNREKVSIRSKSITLDSYPDYCEKSYCVNPHNVGSRNSLRDKEDMKKFIYNGGVKKRSRTQAEIDLRSNSEDLQKVKWQIKKLKKMLKK